MGKWDPNHQRLYKHAEKLLDGLKDGTSTDRERDIDHVGKISGALGIQSLGDEADGYKAQDESDQ